LHCLLYFYPNVKRRITIASFYLFALYIYAGAQVVFKTIIKNAPVAVGESFQVQYVLEDIDRNAEFYPPEFNNFRFINGPYVYEGSAHGADGLKRMKNFVYSLEAMRPGKFLVRGASAKVGDHFIKSDDVYLNVISKKDVARYDPTVPAQEPIAAYFLGPYEDPYEKIRNNLFLKVKVDKKTCFVGEPVTATFKLYSRLVSKSDIVKNPGFYGFTVQDVIGLKDNVSAIETINGEKFDVHTVRKVQLYPLRAGEFTIDALEVMSQVEFSRSVVNKRAEQEISEGVYDHGATQNYNPETFESSMNTKPVFITVKAPPLQGRPAEFAGAVGRFAIKLSADTTRLQANGQGKLVLEISGQGNFTQLSAPAIQWPKGLEGYEPEIKDFLDPNNSGLRGTRRFQYSFVCPRPGSYTIPPVSFSFFDPDSNHYHTVSTSSMKIEVNDLVDRETVVESLGGKSERSYGYLLWSAGILAILSLVFLTGRRYKKRVNSHVKSERNPVLPGVDEIMLPAKQTILENDKSYYTALRGCIWRFIDIYFDIRGSGVSRNGLVSLLQQNEVDHISQQELLDVLEKCETGLFTDARIDIDNNDLFAKTKHLLNILRTKSSKF
jgi:hypothetical protein